MTKKGFITQIILILIVIAIAIFSKNYFSKEPDKFTQESIKSIPKYHKASNWQINNDPKFCFYYLNGCRQAPLIITFNSDDSWPSIYEYYVRELKKFGWETRSHIITSIPSSLILNNENLFKNSSCQLLAKEKDKNLFNFAFEAKSGVFVIEARCSPT